MSDAEIYVIAGEMSGDVLGAGLINALRAQGITRFAGVGGRAMAEAGVRSLFPMADLSVMGFAEILPQLPKILYRLSQTVNDIAARKPAVVVTIDSPGFCFKVVERAKKLCPETKFIHYVAPQVWAWKPERAEKVAHLYDGLICLLPFEPKYFEAHQLKCVFAGHPATELAQRVYVNADTFFEKYDLAQNIPQTLISVLFGSRMGEAKRMAPTLYEAAYRVLHEWPNMRVLVPTTPQIWQKVLKPIIGADQRFVPVDTQDRYQAFALSQAAIATSGTVALELAMLGVPHVVAYKLNALSYMIAKRLVKVPSMHLVNLVTGHNTVPEFLQKEASGTHLAAATLDLLVNKGGAADAQRLAFDEAHNALLGAGGGTPDSQAAQFVQSYL